MVGQRSFMLMHTSLLDLHFPFSIFHFQFTIHNPSVSIADSSLYTREPVSFLKNSMAVLPSFFIAF